MGEDDRRPTWRRLARWIAGDGQEDDDPSSGLPGLAADVRAIWELTDAPAPDPSRWDVEEAWGELTDRIGESGEEGASGRSGGDGRTVGLRRGRSRGGGWSRIAAGIAAAVVLGGGALFLAQLESSPSESRAEVFRTDRAERLEIRLPDGSQVELGPESELSVPAAYNRDARRVRLRGLAFFDVQAELESRFVVRTSGGSVTVLGTRFSVRSFAGEQVQRVVVGEGRVRVAGRRSGPVVLQAGKAGILSADSGLSVRSVDPDRELAWTSGRLVFENTPLRQVARTLDRWYGVEFDVASDELGNRHFTGDFTEESVKQIADIIAASLGVQYEVRDRTVVFVDSE